MADPTLGTDEAGMRAFMKRELFDRIGMATADPRFDEAAALPGDEVLQHIEEAERSGFIRPLGTSGRRYCFTHRHVREAICQSLNPTRRDRSRERLR